MVTALERIALISDFVEIATKAEKRCMIILYVYTKLKTDSLSMQIILASLLIRVRERFVLLNLQNHYKTELAGCLTGYDSRLSKSFSNILCPLKLKP